MLNLFSSSFFLTQDIKVYDHVLKIVFISINSNNIIIHIILFKLTICKLASHNLSLCLLVVACKKATSNKVRRLRRSNNSTQNVIRYINLNKLIYCKSQSRLSFYHEILRAKRKLMHGAIGM